MSGSGGENLQESWVEDLLVVLRLEGREIKDILSLIHALCSLVVLNFQSPSSRRLSFRPLYR